MKKLNYIYKYLKKTFGDTFRAFVFLLGAIWIAVNVIWIVYQFCYMYSGVAPFKNHPRFAAVLMMIIPIIIATIYLFIYIRANNIYVQSEEIKKHQVEASDQLKYYLNIIEENYSTIKDNRQSLMHDIESAKAKNDWDKVIKICKLGARLCLMLSDYDLRIDFGNEMIYAGSKKNDPIAQAIGYIDCLGWSYAKKGCYDDALKCMESGTGFLKHIDNDESNILRGKYYRHRIGMIYLQAEKRATTNKEDNSINEFKRRYEDYCDKIISKDAKAEMKAYLYRLEGDFYRKDLQKGRAKKYYEKSLSLFKKIHDHERAVKLYYDIASVIEKPENALQYYLIGYWLAEDISRTDEMRKNAQLLLSKVEEISAKKDEPKDQILLNAYSSQIVSNAFKEYDLISFENSFDYYQKQYDDIIKRSDKTFNHGSASETKTQKSQNNVQ